MMLPLPLAKHSPGDIRKIALLCAFWMGYAPPDELIALLRERRQMREALDRWADDGGACE